jgi:hypothetical protein
MVLPARLVQTVRMVQQDRKDLRGLQDQLGLKVLPVQQDQQDHRVLKVHRVRLAQQDRKVPQDQLVQQVLHLVTFRLFTALLRTGTQTLVIPLLVKNV